MIIKPRLTTEQKINTLEQSIEKVLAAGLSVFERENQSKSSKVNNHITIAGGIRRVDYWPPTGTVQCPNVKGIYKKMTIRDSNIETAIYIAKNGRI